LFDDNRIFYFLPKIAILIHMFNKKIKLVFFGTPEFASTILAKLLTREDFEVLAVVSESDKPVGRKQELVEPAVKKLVREKSITVLQPEKLDDEFYNTLVAFEADFFVVVAYGKIIPDRFLNLAKKGVLNVHPSLLPKYRGASPIQSAILAGEKETGVTIMLMDKLMDHGPILSQTPVAILDKETYLDLSNRLAVIGAELLVKTILDYFADKIKPCEQKHTEASVCHLLKKTDGEIDWHKTAIEIYNQWRAFVVWPGVYSVIKIKNREVMIKFLELKLSDLKKEHLKSGEFLVAEDKLYVVCGEATVLEVLKLQPAGKKIQTAQEFMHGYLKI